MRASTMRKVKVNGNAGEVQIVRLKPENAENILTALPKETKHGDTFLLLGDQGMRGINHCALVVVGEQRGPGNVPILGGGGKKYATQVNATVDLLGFMIAELLDRLDAQAPPEEPAAGSGAPPVENLN